MGFLSPARFSGSWVEERAVLWGQPGCVPLSAVTTHGPGKSPALSPATAQGQKHHHRKPGPYELSLAPAKGRARAHPIPDGGHTLLGDDRDGALEVGLVRLEGRRGPQLLGQLALSDGSNGAPDAEELTRLLGEVEHHHGTEEPVVLGQAPHLDGVCAACEEGRAGDRRPASPPRAVHRAGAGAIPGCSSRGSPCVTPCWSRKENSRRRRREWQLRSLTASVPWFFTWMVTVRGWPSVTSKRICPLARSCSETISTPCFPRMNSALREERGQVPLAGAGVPRSPWAATGRVPGVLPLLGTAR